MQTKPSSCLPFNLINQLDEAAYILDNDSNLLFVSKAYFNILGMPNHTFKKGEKLRGILEISKRLGVIEQICLDNILRLPVSEAGKTNSSAHLLLVREGHNSLGQAKTFKKVDYKIQYFPLEHGCTYYRFEQQQNPNQMTQVLQKIMRISKTGFYKYDFKKHSYFFCDNLLAWFSRDEQQLIKRNGLFALLSNENREKVKIKLRDLFMRKKEHIEFKAHINFNKKHPSVLEICLNVNYDKDGNPLNFLAIVHDITVQENSNDRIKKQKDEADENAQFRANQIAHMSHEIRTPMSGIIGMVDILLNEDHSDKTIEKIKIIKQSSDLMMQTLTETLDHCKLMAGGVSLNPVSVSSEDLLRSTHLLWSDKAYERDVTIEYSLSPDFPEIIKIDPYRIKQCLNNLLSNAVKFTHSGEIIISMKKHINQSGESQLIILVSDTGIGMTAEQIEKLFNPFSQADESIAEKFGGTGLGMSITKKIIETMQGRILVKSKKDAGTSIALLLPLKPVIKRADKMTNPNTNDIRNIRLTQYSNKPKFRREKILIVDDIETNRAVLQFLLCDTFPNLIFANNGQQAIDILHEKNIDIILMDIHMPILNGMDATKAIRSSDFPYKDVPIVAVTADEEYHKRVSCQVVGFDDVIAKPVDRLVLLETINKSLEKPRIRAGNVRPLFA